MNTGNGEIAYLLGVGVGTILVLSVGLPIISKKLKSAKSVERKPDGKDSE